MLTLAGVAWTIHFTSKENKRQDELKVRPIPIYTTNKCFGFSQFHTGHLISVGTDYENIKFYLFKNIGQSPFKIDIGSDIEKTNWILPNEEFALGLRVDNTSDVIQIQITDILNNVYVYEISFNDIFRISNFKNIK